MSEWIQKTIGELCDLGGGKVKTGPFGSQLHQSDYQEEGIPVVMPTNIVNGSIDVEKIARVAESHVERLYIGLWTKSKIVRELNRIKKGQRQMRRSIPVDQN